MAEIQKFLTRIGNKETNIYHSTEYLGVYVDTNLIFISQIEVTTEKLSHCIDLVAKMQLFVSRK